MQKIKRFIQTNLKLMSVALVASLTGGLIGTVLVTQAAIPASDGTIHGCRSNTTTMLRVIDDTSQTCDSSESALNWDQKGVKAYGFVGYGGGTHALDTNRSYNISSLQHSDPLMHTRQFCFTVNGSPQNISASVSDKNQEVAALGIKDSNGWTSPNNTCDTQSPGSNAFVKLSPFGGSFFVTVH